MYEFHKTIPWITFARSLLFSIHRVLHPTIIIVIPGAGAKQDEEETDQEPILSLGETEGRTKKFFPDEKLKLSKSASTFHCVTFVQFPSLLQVRRDFLLPRRAAHHPPTIQRQDNHYYKMRKPKKRSQSLCILWTGKLKVTTTTQKKRKKRPTTILPNQNRTCSRLYPQLLSLLCSNKTVLQSPEFPKLRCIFLGNLLDGGWRAVQEKPTPTPGFKWVSSRSTSRKGIVI